MSTNLLLALFVNIIAGKYEWNQNSTWLIFLKSPWPPIYKGVTGSYWLNKIVKLLILIKESK